ncbi:MAG: addiction module protein [Nitrospirae bacterium GWC2_42_7]|nr:MAG: addiction module protein [Nitrospirae bacterium GWC2_42_7]
MKYDPHKPYNQLPLLPPRKDLETKAILKKAIAAGRALAELKGIGSNIPNQTILINTIALQEAKSSSEIENIVTTNDALFKAFSAQSSHIDAATKEVLHYREALWEGFNTLKKRPVITTSLLINLVQTIKQNQAGIRNAPGTAVANASSGEVLYTPPEGESVIRDKLKNLEDYIHGEDSTDPLVKLAVMHYQFEAIHPFFDGNGRTGRILCILFLIHRELLELPILYLSKAIIETKTDYYKLLRQVTASDSWEPWVLYMLDVIENTAVDTRMKIIAIRDLLEKTLDSARKKLPSRVYSKELIELLFHQPYTKSRFLVDAGIAERKTAAEYLKELENIGILKSKKLGKENLYLNVKLYDLLSK